MYLGDFCIFRPANPSGGIISRLKLCSAFPLFDIYSVQEGKRISLLVAHRLPILSQHITRCVVTAHRLAVQSRKCLLPPTCFLCSQSAITFDNLVGCHYAIFLYGGFEAVGDKWLHETSEDEEECTKPRKQTLTRQQPFKKGLVSISESSTHDALFL